MTKNRDKQAQYIDVAKQTWEVMHKEAKNRGMALIRDKKLGDGRVIVATVGAFIKGLNSERSWGLDQHDVDFVRRFLKTTGNVVVLNKIEQYKFRIFIREEWSDAVLVTETITKDNPSREDKISPQDAGEDREPAPVEYKCHCGKTYDSQPALNAHKGIHKREKVEKEGPQKSVLMPTAHQQKKILRILVDVGGEIEHPRGLVNRVLLERDPSITKDSIGHSITSLRNHGLIRRDGNLRRTYKIALTPKGRREIKKLFGPDTNLPPEKADEGDEKETGRTAPSASNSSKSQVTEDAPEKVQWLTDQFLLDELWRRLEHPRVSLEMTKELETAKQRLELIEGIVEEVNAGKITPLKGLGDIEEAVRL